jgi:hypothetical protein
MISAREGHTASVLPNGNVLVSGGSSGGVFVNSAELYDPSTGVWTITANMSSIRYGHTAYVLTNGTVLVTGEQTLSGYLKSAKSYAS